MTETSSTAINHAIYNKCAKCKIVHIFSRSQQRGDSENIQRWLSNHFIVDHCDFPHVYPALQSPIMPFILALMQKSPARAGAKAAAMSAFTTLTFSTATSVAMERDLVEFLSCQEANAAGKLNCSASTALPCWQCAKRSIKKRSACVNKAGIPPTARR